MAEHRQDPGQTAHASPTRTGTGKCVSPNRPNGARWGTTGSFPTTDSRYDDVGDVLGHHDGQHRDQSDLVHSNSSQEACLRGSWFHSVNSCWARMQASASAWPTRYHPSCPSCSAEIHSPATQKYTTRNHFMLLFKVLTYIGK